MARMNSKVRREFDAAADVTLRDADDGAETATASETGVPLNLLTDAYWDNDDQPNGVIMVSFHIAALDRTTGDETYTFTIQTDTLNAFGSAVEVARLTGVTAPGYYEVPVSTQLIEKLDPTAAFIRVSATLAGTTPSVTYGAWMTYLDV